tara:strand:+ start:11821 stop:12105 length:285 start_codon:yes stop_codon:yes gene_type:complete
MGHPLQGKPVCFRREGFYCGIVRKVTMTRGTKKRPAQIKTLVVQRPGGEMANMGKSYSARCGGDRVRLKIDEVTGVSWFGKMRPVCEVLSKLVD